MNKQKTPIETNTSEQASNKRTKVQVQAHSRKEEKRGGNPSFDHFLQQLWHGVTLEGDKDSTAVKKSRSKRKPPEGKILLNDPRETNIQNQL